MTKKTDDLASTSDPLHAKYRKTAEAWVARQMALGTAGALAKRAPRFEPDQAETSAESICSIPAADVEVAKLLTKAGIEAHFFAAMKTLHTNFTNARKPLPPDLRNQEVLTPAERAQVDANHQLLSDVRDSLFDAARSSDQIEELALLGRGTAIGRTVESVRDALQMFLAAVPSRTQLLEDAAITEEDLAELRAALLELQEIAVAAEARSSGATVNARDTLVWQLALESFIVLFAARAKSALRGKPLLKERTLERLPRAPERRRSKPTAAAVAAKKAKADAAAAKEAADAAAAKAATGAGSTAAGKDAAAAETSSAAASFAATPPPMSNGAAAESAPAK